MWLPYLDRYDSVVGIIEDRVFYPICRGCVFNVQNTHFFDTPLLKLLRKKLKRKEIEVYKVSTFCVKQRGIVGFPKSCECRIEEGDKALLVCLA